MVVLFDFGLLVGDGVLFLNMCCEFYFVEVVCNLCWIDCMFVMIVFVCYLSGVVLMMLLLNFVELWDVVMVLCVVLLNWLWVFFDY